jgi:hypothetical protein
MWRKECLPSRASRLIALFLLLFASACSEEVATTPPSAASAGAGASPDLIGDLMLRQQLVCARLSASYGNMPTCVAPGDGGAIIQYENPDVSSARIEDCLRSFSSRAAIDAWLPCHLDALNITLSCYVTCPMSGTTCAQLADQKLDECPELEGKQELLDCYAAPL